MKSKALINLLKKQISFRKHLGYHVLSYIFYIPRTGQSRSSCYSFHFRLPTVWIKHHHINLIRKFEQSTSVGLKSKGGMGRGQGENEYGTFPKCSFKSWHSPWLVLEKRRQASLPACPHNFHNFFSEHSSKTHQIYYQIILFPLLETTLKAQEYTDHSFLKQGGTPNCPRNTRHNKTPRNMPQTQNTLYMSWGQKSTVVFTYIVKSEDNLSFSSTACNQKGTKCK